jgi:hypothetical protein
MATAKRRIKLTDTNPKDRLGIKKIPFGLCSTVAHVYWALAQKDGAVKYGEYNWRNKPVREDIYLEAIERHAKAMRAGQVIDAKSGLPHAGHIMACAAIIEDARAAGCLILSTYERDHGVEVMDFWTDQEDYDKTEAQIKKSRTPARTLGEVAGNPISPTIQETVLKNRSLTRAPRK